ncbi:MAG TPA: MaoC/PaaZ C-terminal domain-containing protein [Caulobacteraceae bacterium]|jgi:acyl dehydratase|nr:MaoC/PaaZ C-terminal domain-containing protein [Caulobacteraceae bacterium]
MSSPAPKLTFDNLEDHIEREIALTPWVRISQADVTAFGHLTGDPDPMHVDPAWARAESPYGVTVLAGLHLLSLLPRLSRGSGLEIGGVQLAMNYGFNRVRFVAPVPVGAELRNRIRLLSVDRRADGKAALVTRNVFEVRDVEGPAMIAEWVNLLWPESKA